MKRFIKGLIMAMLVVCMASCCAFASDGDVEISFRVGDSTLSINGTDTPVETPYVVGDGVTLVPVRVITEAFGAKVGWVEETSTVTLDYPDVNIILQIGNSVAEVNGKAETLLAAPELTEAGYTMVPLRFISENFGAEVSYDDATEAIKVVKKASGTASSTVVGSVNDDYIGDSYYGWTMENPKDMVMDERTFDGLLTCFSYGEDHEIYIACSPLSKDYDFDREFNNNKASLSDYTLVKAEKNTEGDIKSAHFQARSKDMFMNTQYYVNDKFLVEAVGYFSNEDTAKRDEFIRIMSTFEMKFDGAKAHDLSNVVDGWRTCEDDDTGFSVLSPDDYYQSEDDSQNEFDFYAMSEDDNVSHIRIGMYSKSEVGSAIELARKDLTNNKLVTNENLFTYTDITPMKYNGIETYEYTDTVSGSRASDCIRKDVFFENGDYVYNISVSVKMPNDRAETIMAKVLNNIKVNTIDSSKTGIIMRNDIDKDSFFTAKTDMWTIELPNSYQELSKDEESAIYMDSASGIMISLIVKNGSELGHDPKKLLKEFVAEGAKKKNVYTEGSIEQVRLGKHLYSHVVTRTESDEGIAYSRQYCAYTARKMCIIIVGIPELAYSRYNIDRVEKIAASLAVE